MKTKIEWANESWNGVAGVCPGMCPYCYVPAMAETKPNMARKYAGVPKLTNEPVPKAGIVFVCSCMDLGSVSDTIVERVLNRFATALDNPVSATAIFLTKNPGGFSEMRRVQISRNLKMWIGTTVENAVGVGANVPPPADRLKDLAGYRTPRKWVSVEPAIKPFDPEKTAALILAAKPTLAIIGGFFRNMQTYAGFTRADPHELINFAEILTKGGVKVYHKKNAKYAFEGREVDFPQADTTIWKV